MRSTCLAWGRGEDFVLEGGEDFVLEGAEDFRLVGGDGEGGRIFSIKNCDLFVWK